MILLPGTGLAQPVISALPDCVYHSRFTDGVARLTYQHGRLHYSHPKFESGNVRTYRDVIVIKHYAEIRKIQIHEDRLGFTGRWQNPNNHKWFLAHFRCMKPL